MGTDASPPSVTPLSDDTTFPELGYPVRIFIDTSVYRGMNFAFGGNKLKALLSAVEAGDAQLLLPEITRREVVTQIEAAVEDSTKAIKVASGDAMIIRNLPTHPLAVVFENNEWGQIRESLLKQWEDFAKSAKAIPIHINGSSSTAIFEAYFQKAAPFKRAGKKSEFPDAFVLDGLREFGRANACKIAVVSSDRDFHDGCEGCSTLVRCDDLAKLLAHSRWLATFHPKRIREKLRPHEEQLEKEILAAFSDMRFYWASFEHGDTDRVEIYDESVEHLDAAVIDVDDVWATVAGEATIKFLADATPDDHSFGKPGSSSHFFPPPGDVTIRMVSEETVPYSVRVNVPELGNNVFETEDLIVNERNPVVIVEEQILAVIHNKDE